MTKLSDDRLHELHKAAIEAKLTPSRTALLGGLDGSISAALPHTDNPSSQLLSDLQTLNDTEPADGSIPLLSWLNNARRLTVRLKQCQAFEEAIEELSRSAISAEQTTPTLGLEAAYAKLKRLTIAGQDTSSIKAEILNLKREEREGVHLRAGDALSNGRYALIKKVGKGGFAVVWKAYDEHKNRLVAIKVLHGQYAEDKTRRDRFFRGARLMKEMNHPHIVSVLEEDCRDGDWFYFVMEFIEGQNLHEAVLDGGFGSFAGLDIICKVGEALHYAHKKGVIHRDIKPANILLDMRNKPYLTDFDLVQAFDTTGGTRTGALGTFIYAAPECLDKPQEATIKADVYSLAMTALFVLSSKKLPMKALRSTEVFVDDLALDTKLGVDLKSALNWEYEERPSMLQLCMCLEPHTKHADDTSTLTVIDELVERVDEFIESEINADLPEASQGTEQLAVNAPWDSRKSQGLVQLAGQDVVRLFEPFLDGNVSQADLALNQLNRDNPHTVKVFEDVFRAMGLAVLEGATPPSNLLEKLWREQEGLVFWRHNEFPFPRMERGDQGKEARHSLWLIACLAISEALQESPYPMDPRLALWRADNLNQAAVVLLTQIHGVWEPVEDAPRWTLSMYGLAGRLYRHLDGNKTDRISEWQRPARLIERMQQGATLLPDDVSWINGSSLMIPALRAEAEQASVPWVAVINAIWIACAEKTHDKNFLRVDGPFFAEFWPHIPKSVLKGRLVSSWAQLPYDKFTSEHWKIFREVWVEKPGQRYTFENRQIWNWIPESNIAEMLLNNHMLWDDRIPWKNLYLRFPQVLTDTLWLYILQGHAKEGFNLLFSLPAEAHIPNFSERLRGWIQNPPADEAARRYAMSYLHHLVDKKVPGWEQAYTLMEQLEPVIKPHAVESRTVDGNGAVSQQGPVFNEHWVEPVSGIEFLWVPPGAFWMGSSKTRGERGYDEEAYEDELPGCEVTLTHGYWMAKHPVTRARYQLFMKATGHREPKWWGLERFSHPRKPVVGVSWDDAMVYCKWLTESGELPSGVKAVLPTEARWERAARGTEGCKYPWGNESSNETLACYGLDGITGSPAEIGERPEGRSPIGCEDMAGNIWEWCLDNYSNNLKHLQTNNVDPCHADDKSARVLRGGSWNVGARRLRCVCRDGCGPRYRDGLIGFRVSCVFEHAP